jgi:hypothetical protein
MRSLDHLIDDERHRLHVARANDGFSLPIAGLCRRLA